MERTNEDVERELRTRYAPTLVTQEPRYQQKTADIPGDAPAHVLPAWDLDGVPWHRADPPRRAHRHWGQTVGQVKLFHTTQRCACGAIREDSDGWVLLDPPRVSTTRGERLVSRLCGLLESTKRLG